jgi:phage FluMu protein gp41
MIMDKQIQKIRIMEIQIRNKMFNKGKKNGMELIKRYIDILNKSQALLSKRKL